MPNIQLKKRNCACFQSNNQKTDQSVRIYQEGKTRKKKVYTKKIKSYVKEKK